MSQEQAEYNTVHPDCPKKLRSAYRKAGYNARELARRLGINIYYVHQALRHGERPSNNNIARALYFPREYKRREPSEPKPEAPEHIKWWRAIDKTTRLEWIRSAYHAVSDTEKSNP